MSLTPEDVAAILTKSAGYDSTHTPRSSAVLTAAWLEHFDRYAPEVTRAQALDAVTEYHRQPHDRMLQPADLTAVIRAQFREQLDRLDTEARNRPGDEKTADDLPPYPGEWGSTERLTAYWYVVKNRTVTRPVTTDNWRTILNTARRARQGVDA